jgi:hypothetical protein
MGIYADVVFPPSYNQRLMEKERRGLKWACFVKWGGYAIIDFRKIVNLGIKAQWCQHTAGIFQ